MTNCDDAIFENRIVILSPIDDVLCSVPSRGSQGTFMHVLLLGAPRSLARSPTN